MKKNFFKLNRKFQAELNMDALLERVRIKKHIIICSAFDFYSKYKFNGKYDKNDNLLMMYNYMWSTKPIVIISETDSDKYDIEIKYDNYTKAIILFLFLLLFFFLIISVAVKSVEFALYVLAFGIVLTLFVYLIFFIAEKKIMDELEEFIIKEE